MILSTLAFVFAIGAAVAFNADTVDDVYAKPIGQSCQNIENCTSAIQDELCEVEVVDNKFYASLAQCTINSSTTVTAYIRP